MSKESDETFRRQMVDDIVKQHFTQQPLSHAEHVMQEVMALTNNIRKTILPDLIKGAAFDQAVLGPKVSELYRQGLEQFDKDELVLILTVLHTEIFMKVVGNDPWGSGMADLLSGV